MGNPGSAIPGFDRALDQSLTTLQPFVQLDWNALPGLILSPGIRYDYFERRVDSQVNVQTALPQRYSNTFDAVLPSLLAHYELSPNWAAYAQAAKGFLAPNENFFNRADPNSTNVQPQQSWNYQLGTSWQSQRLSVSADVYYIDFTNLIGSRTISGVGVLFFNQGGVTYKGIEAEATGYLGAGFNAYVNGSINSAKDKQSGLSIANAPTATAAAGVIYNLNGWYASLLDKWVGDRYGDVGDAQPLSSYSTLDGALGYTFNDGLWGSSKPSLKLAFNNLLNSTKIYALAGYTAAASTPLYWTIPGRSIFATLTVPF
jgi:iron complex outermembrane receptor protein